MLKKEQFPKILVVDGTYLSRNGNMGILKSHILSQWPNTELVHIVTSGIIDYNSIASKQFIITKKGILSFRSGFELKNISNAINNEVTPLQVEANDNKFKNLLYKSKTILFTKAYTIYKPLTHLIRSSSGVFSKRLHKFISEFNPDIILTFGVTLPELKTAYKISAQYKKPLIMYIADDYISWTYTDHLFSKYLRSEFEKYFNLCIETSMLRITIGKKMEEEYSKRYKIDFHTIMDGIDISSYYNRPVRAISNELKFCFLGSLEPNRWINLHSIGKVIDILNKKRQEKIHLYIYAFKNDKIKFSKNFNSIDCVKFMDTVPFTEVPDIQMTSDCLIHIESFDDLASSSMTKYSISTKICQYLTSGTPIFAFGPGNIASIEYLKYLDAAKIVDEENLQLLESGLSAFLNELQIHNKKANKLREIALGNYSIEHSGQEFNRLVFETLNNYKEN